MSANLVTASTIQQAFPLPADFPSSFLRFLAPVDQSLVSEIFPAWRSIIEWMYANGELTSCSLRLFRDMLPVEKAILRRQDMPSDLRQGIQRALNGVCQRTGLNRQQIIDHWNTYLVTKFLTPWMEDIASIES